MLADIVIHVEGGTVKGFEDIDSTTDVDQWMRELETAEREPWAGELEIGTPLELWEGVPGESLTERSARLAAAADIYADLVALETDPEADADFAYSGFVADTAPKHTRRRIRLRSGVVQWSKNKGHTYYALNLHAVGLPAVVVVTARGHWYRTDDPGHPMWNDPVCRGCGARGHFEYILDRVPCGRPGSFEDAWDALTAGLPSLSIARIEAA